MSSSHISRLFHASQSHIEHFLILNIHNDIVCSISNICHFQPPLLPANSDPGFQLSGLKIFANELLKNLKEDRKARP